MLTRSIFASSLVLSVFLTLAPAALARQAAEFAVNLAAGSERAYSVEQTLELQQTRGEATTSSAVEHRATLAFKVDDVNADGSLRLTATFRALSINFTTPAKTAAYSKSLPTEAGAKGSDDEALNTLGNALFGCSISIEVDPSGVVRPARGLEPFIEAAQSQESFDGRIAGFFTPSKFAAFVQPMFDADGARGKKMSAGIGWQREEETVPLPPVGAIDLMTDYKFVELANGVATIRGTTEPTLKLPKERDPAVATLTLGERSIKTEMQWDTAAGAAKLRERLMTLTTNWELGDIKLQQVQKSATRFKMVVGQ